MTPAGLPSTIHGLRRLISNGSLSVEEAIILQHRAIPHLNDIYRCATHTFPLPRAFPDKALALSGVGLAHKDIFHMLGRTPDCGAGLPARPSSRQASVIRHSCANGAIVLAALAMPEHASGVTGENPLLPELVNPIDHNATVGGSSSGSAVAVAAGLCYGSFGTDTAGSVRIPAATCGVVGFKPSRGILPLGGVAPLARSLDTVGILARTPIDSAIVFQAALSDRQNHTLFGGNAVEAMLREEAGRASKSRLRLALEHSNPRIHLRNDIDTALRRLTTTLSTTRHEIHQLDIEEISRYAEIVLKAQASAVHISGLASGTRPIGKFVRHLVLSGAAIPSAWYLDALNQRVRATVSFARNIFADADFLITPVLPQGVPDRNAVHTDSEQFAPRALLDLFSWTAFVNYLGLPAIVLPIGSDEFGRPISAQILAKPGNDFKLLAFAAYAFDALNTSS